MRNKPIELMWDDEPINVTSEVNFIWSIANKLRGPYRSDKYKDVIIPIVIIRRHKRKSIDKIWYWSKFADTSFCQTSRYDFYNTNKYDLVDLINEPDNIAGNFRKYIKGFSPNIQDIIKKFRVR